MPKFLFQFSDKFYFPMFSQLFLLIIIKVLHFYISIKEFKTH